MCARQHKNCGTSESHFRIRGWGGGGRERESERASVRVCERERRLREKTIGPMVVLDDSQHTMHCNACRAQKEAQYVIRKGGGMRKDD